MRKIGNLVFWACAVLLVPLGAGAQEALETLGLGQNVAVPVQTGTRLKAAIETHGAAG